jgi:hypothetical protein
MTADSNSDIAWHRVQLRKNRNAVKALEIAHFRTGNIAASSDQSQKNIAILKRKIAESERCIAAHERRTKRPVATDLQSLASMSWSSWNARRVSWR